MPCNPVKLNATNSQGYLQTHKDTYKRSSIRHLFSAGRDHQLFKLLDHCCCLHFFMMLEYKNLSWVSGADRKIHPRVRVWHQEALIFLSTPTTLLDSFSCIPFDLKVGAIINESHSYTLTSAILKVDSNVTSMWHRSDIKSQHLNETE